MTAGLNTQSQKSFTYIDLFAGCGGLSLGLRRAGGTLIAAVEKSEMAAQTYAANFLNLGKSNVEWQNFVTKPITEQLDSKLFVSPIRDVLDTPEVMEKLRDARVDVVAGGPPCQGFSLAGRRNPEDIRNKLAWEFLELVEEVSPKIVLIENVVGMNHTFEKGKSSSFQQLQEALRLTGVGYKVQGLAVNALHFGAPQHRPRMMILGVRKDLTVSKKINEQDIWKSSFVDSTKPKSDFVFYPEPILSTDATTLKDAIGDLQFQKIYEDKPNQSSTFRNQIRTTSMWGVSNSGERDLAAVPNHNPRSHNPNTISRFRIYQWLKSQGLSPRFLSEIAHSEIKDILPAISHVEYPAVSPDGTILAESAESMAKLIQLHKTKKHSQTALSWNEPARTVVTLPDDYVHPSEPRIFTVRELARFQGFPDDFVFYGKETTGALRRRFEVPQYSQVGNAVSPFLGYAMGRLIVSILLSE